MAYFACRNGSSGGSGTVSYTTLWTNSSPSSDFSGQDINLTLQTCQTYDFIIVRSKHDKSDTFTKNANIFDTSKLHSEESSTPTNWLRYFIFGVNSRLDKYNSNNGLNWLSRGFQFKSNGTFHFGNGGLSSSTTPERCEVPVSIIGAKGKLEDIIADLESNGENIFYSNWS